MPSAANRRAAAAPSRHGRIRVAIGGVLLLAYGMLTLLVASAWARAAATSS